LDFRGRVGLAIAHTYTQFSGTRTVFSCKSRRDNRAKKEFSYHR